MSKTIDEKVVSMEFENKNFERNARESMNTLDKLKSKLNFDNAKKSAECLQKALSNVNNQDMSNLTKVAVSIKDTFSTLEIVGISTIHRLTNEVITLGKNTIKAFTIDPVKSGFQEYELKMGSVQTILNSTGESLETVNSYLNELNKYSDDTIYSFQDMTSNIGKFTNQGVKLKDAVMAIKGVSNEAALAGANAQQASHAMYNFAQALSSGSVKLIDWKSIENANMATMEFKQELIKTGVELGTLSKQGNKYVSTTKDLNGHVSQAFSAETMFNESLSSQWMTTDVLVKTLNRYADETTDIGKKAKKAATEIKTFSMMMDTLKEAAQSGWAQTWEIVFGDFNQGKKMWTAIGGALGKIIENSSNKRNKAISDLLDGTGGTGSWDKILKRVNSAGVATKDFKKAIISAAKVHNKSIDSMIKKAGGFDKALQKGIVTKKDVIKALQNLSIQNKKVSKSQEDLTKKYEYFKKVVSKVWNGDYKNGKERIDALTKAGYNYAEVQRLVDKCEKGRALTLADLSDKELKAVGYTEKQITAIKELAKEAEIANSPLDKLLNNLTKKSGRTLIEESIENIVKIGKTLFGIFDKVKKNVFKGSKTNTLYKLIESFHDLTEAMQISEKQSKNFERIMTGLMSGAKWSSTLISKSATSLVKFISAVLGLFGTDLLTVIGNLADMVTKFTVAVDSATLFNNTIAKFARISVTFLTELKAIGGAIGEVIEKNKVLHATFQPIYNFIEKLKTAIQGELGNSDNWIAVESIEKSIKSVSASLQEWIRNIPVDESAGEYIAKGITGMFTYAITSVKNKLKEKIIEMGGDISKGFAYGLGDGIRKSITKTIHSIKAYVHGEFAKLGINSADGFINGIQNGFEKVHETMSNTINSLINFVKGLLGIHSPSIVFKSIGSFVMEGFIQGIISKGSSVKTKIFSIFTGVISYVKSIFGIHSPSKVMFAIGGFVMAGFLMGLTKSQGGVVDFFKNLVENIKATLSEMTSGDLIVAGIGLGTLFTVNSLIKAANKFTDFLVTITKPLTGFGKIAENFAAEITRVGKSIEKIGKSYANKNNAEAILSLAKALAILVGSVVALAYVPFSKVALSTGAIVVLIGSLLALAWEMDKLDTKSLGAKFASLGTLLFSLAAVVAVMGIIAYKMGKMDSGALATGIFGVVTIVAALGAFITVITKSIGKLTPKKLEALPETLKSISKLMRSLSITIGLVAVTVKLLGSMSLGELSKGITAMGLIGALMVAFIKFANIPTTNVNNIKKITTVMRQLSITMVLVSVALKMIAKISMADIGKGIIVMGAFTALIYALGKVAKVGKKSTIEFSNMMIKLSISMILLTHVLKAIRKIDAVTIVKGTIAMGLLTAFLIAMGHCAKYATNKDMSSLGTMLLKMSVSIGLLGVALKLIGSIPIGNAAKGIAVIGAFELLLTAYLKLNKNMRSKKHMLGMGGMLTLMTGSMILMAVSLKIVSTIPIDGISKGMLVISSFTALMVAMTKCAKYSGKNADNVGRMLLSAATAVLILVGAVALVTLINEDKVYKATAVVITLVGGVSLMFKALSSLTEFKMDKINAKSLVKLGMILGGVSLMIANILGIMSAFNVNNAIENATGLGILLTAFSVSMTILGKTDTMTVSMNSLKAMGVLTLIVSGLGAILGIMGQFNISGQIQNATALGILINALAIALIPLGVGGMFGPLALEGAKYLGLIVVAILGGLVSLGTLDTLLKGGIESSIKRAMNIFATISEGVGNIIAKFAKGAISELPSICTTISDSMKDLSIDESTANGIKNLASALLILTGEGILESLAGILPGFGKKMSAESLSEKFTALGTAIKAFANSVIDMPTGNIEAASKATKSILSVMKSIPNTGGIVQDFIGEKDFTGASEGIENIGSAIASFAKSVSAKDVNYAQCETAITHIASIIGIMNDLPNTGSVVAKFFGGEKDLSGFADDMSNLGDGFKSFATSLNGIGSDEATMTALKQGIGLIGALVDATKNISDSKWIDKIISGSKSKYEVFGSCMGSIGSGFAEFYEAVKDIELTKVSDRLTPIMDTMESIVNIGKDMKNSGGIMNFVSAINNLADADIKGMIDAFNVNMGDFKKNVASIGETLSSGILSSQKKVSSSVLTVISNACTEISSSGVLSKYKEMGTTAISKIIYGMNSKKKAASATAIDINKTISSKFNNMYDRAKLNGQYIIDGLIDGINYKKPALFSLIDTIITHVNELIIKKEQIHSPSKVMHKLGGYIGQGLINGIRSKQSGIYAEAYNMTESIRNATIGINNVFDSLNDDIEEQYSPVITPVVNLSYANAEIKKASRSISLNTELNMSRRTRKIKMDVQASIDKPANEFKSVVKDLKHIVDSRPNVTNKFGSITYDNGSNINDAVETLIDAFRVGKRR